MSVYRITRVSCGVTLEQRTRKQFPAAIDVLWHEAYEALEGDGALATPRAWRIRRAVNALTRDIHSATFECGAQSLVTIERVE